MTPTDLTIHPLRAHGEPPFPRDPNGVCQCDWCRHWFQLIRTLLSKLDEPGQALLNEYVNHSEHVAMDLDYAEARLAGSWPGWEAMKGFKPVPQS